MSMKISLEGAWSFRLDTEKKGLSSHYEQQDFDDTILLPGTVSQARKGTPHSGTATGFLTDPYEMSGYSWFRREVSLPFKAVSELAGRQFELTLERTRISYVWVDGAFAGSLDSFTARHCHDLTGYIKTLKPVITIMVSNTDYKVPGGHMTSPDTQTNWNGILGEISLTIREAVRIGNIDARCDFEKKGVLLHIPIQQNSAVSRPALLSVRPVLCHLKDIYAEPDGNIPEDAAFEELAEIRRLPRESISRSVDLRPGKNEFELFLDLSGSGMLWDEENPYVYRLDVTVSCPDDAGRPEVSSSEKPDGLCISDGASLYTGLRSFTADGTNFCINGRKTFLRGRQDGMIFPLTGYAPMNVAGWLHVMKIARDFGINHYRFHTCCPPEAAFTAADLLGIYMQPELPFWGTFNGPEDEGYDKEAQDFLEAEGFRMLESFSNHPSYCMMSMGNELWGNASAINGLLAKYKAFRPDILYTQGSNNFYWAPNIQPNDDFFSGVRFTIDRQIRGSYAMCDKPQGHIQTAAPDTRFNYDNAIRPVCPEKPAEASVDGTIEIQYGTGVKQVKLTEAGAELVPQIPVVSHEIGQYETYPDFSEIEKYTGVLKPRNLMEFKRRLAEKRMLPLAHDFFRSSGALAVACYKNELETALRSSYLAGFQLLDIQDFTGQGTALVGILNAFMENKGLISVKDWRRFCSDAVIQAEFDSYIVTAGQEFPFAVSLSRFRRDALPDGRLLCRLTAAEAVGVNAGDAGVNAGDAAQSAVNTDAAGENQAKENAALACISRNISSVTDNGRHILGDFRLTIPPLNKPAALRLTVELEGTGIENSYTLWAYPETDPFRLPKEYPHAFSCEELPDIAQQAKSCLLFLSAAENRASIEGTYCTDFWCYPMFRSISLSMNKEAPVGTMGLLILKEHEALHGFPCESFTTPQWYSIVTASRSTILDDTDIWPIVQTIDNFDRNHRLGLLYEIYLKDLDLGVLVCASDLPRLIREKRPEAAALYNSLVSCLPRLAEKRTEKYALNLSDFTALLSADKNEL